MIKESLSEAGLSVFAVVGLVAFFATFAGVAIWALTRRQKQIDKWSSLPLADGKDPVEPRDRPDEDRHAYAAQSCGKCENCTCAPAAVMPTVWKLR